MSRTVLPASSRFAPSGAVACEPLRLRALLSVARGARASEFATPGERPRPLVVTGAGLAVISIDGLMTKDHDSCV